MPEAVGKSMKFFALVPAALLLACSPSGEAEGNAEPPGATATPAPAPDAGRLPSRYTSLAECRLLRSNPEEGGFYEHECPGEGGYRLRKSESDLRENIVVLDPDGGEHDLSLTALARGAFNSLGDRAEWIGEEAEGDFVPRALIFRQSVMEDPDPAVPEVSWLVVAKLGDAPCVVARIAPGPAQNEQAREAAARNTPCLPPPA